MALKHDTAGFLVGEIIKTQDDILSVQQDSYRVFTRMRADVSSIARALNVQAKVQARSSSSGPGGKRVAPTVSPAGRSGGGRGTGSNQSATSRAASSAVGRRATSSVAATSARDSKGRFVAGQGKGDGGAAGGGGLAALGGGLSRLSDGMGKLSASLNSADNIDPTVNAMKEVHDVVSPLGRGLTFMFGRTAERKKERWYMRIIKAIQTPIPKKGQEEAAARGGSGSPVVRMFSSVFGSVFGRLGPVFAAIPALLGKVVMRVFAPIAALWGSWELGKWIGGKIYEWLDESGWNTKLFDAVDWLRDTFGNAWSAVGDGIDSVVSMITGAWKTITDGFKSALDSFMEFPKKLGEFFSGLDESMRNLPVVGKMYAKAADAIKETAGDAKRGYDEGKSGKTDAPAASALQAMGRDVGKGVAAVQAVGAQAGAGYDEAQGKRTDAPAPSGIVQRAARTAGGMAGKVADRWSGGAKDDIVAAASTSGVDAGLLAQIAHFESGFNKDAMPITRDGRKLSSAHGYGQFLDGTWVDMVRKNGGKYGVENASKLTKEQALALRGDTKLQAGMLAEYTKENTALGRKLGGADDSANIYALHNLGAGDGSKLLKALKANPDAPVSSILSGNVISGNKSLYGDGSISVKEAYDRMGSKMRSGDAYAQDARAAQNAPMSVATAGMVAPRNANIPAAVPAQLPDAAPNEVPEKLNSGAAAGARIQVALKDRTTQNIGDRGIAHIASGGMGSA